MKTKPYLNGATISKIGVIAVFGLMLLFISVAHSRSYLQKTESTYSKSLLPNKQFAVHRTGQLGLTITNYGALGTGHVSNPIIDGEVAPSAEFPYNSDLNYLYSGSIWIGSIVGSDTVVSCGHDGWIFQGTELNPEDNTAGEIISRSNNINRSDFHPDAIAEQEFICQFFDTLTLGISVDPEDNRPHIPLEIDLVQKSYSWDLIGLEDFVLFENELENIGTNDLEAVYIGIFIDGDVFHESNSASGYTDDITGFLAGENIAYIMDNDGDPISAQGNLVWDFRSPRAAIGLKFHGCEDMSCDINFNWWISNGNPALDFGPRMAGTTEDPFYSFGPQLGTPTGDRSKYYTLSHPEWDYDQLFTTVDHTSVGFLPPPPPAQAIDFSNGFDTRFLISTGPFDIDSGESIKYYYSIIMGENVHVVPEAFRDFYDPLDPAQFYNKLDFSDLVANATIADSICHELSHIPTYANDGNEPIIPNKTTLSDNYPNPFNPMTTIDYTLPKSEHVTVTIYDIIGRKIKTLVDEEKSAGRYSITWNGTDENNQSVASGIYFYKLSVVNHSEVKKMVLLK